MKTQMGVSRDCRSGAEAEVRSSAELRSVAFPKLADLSLKFMYTNGACPSTLAV